MTSMQGNRSLVRLLVAVVLCVLALTVLVLTERKATVAARADDGAGGAVINVGSAPPPDDVDGHIVRVSGTTSVPRPAQDIQFGVVAPAPRLYRRVTMFEWHENDYGGSTPAYAVRWMDHAIDSSRFIKPEGHANPGPFPIKSASFAAPEVKIGHFTLAQAIVNAIPGSESFPVDVYKLPPNLVASLSQFGDGLTTSTYPRNPHVGDLRINWSVVPNQELTIMALARNGRLQPSPALPPPGFVLMLGNMPMTGLVPGRPEPPSHPWIARLAALALMLAGAWLLLGAFDGRGRADPMVWPALAVLPLALVEMVFWFGVRAGVVIAGIVVVAAAIALIVWRVRTRAAG